MAGFADHSTDSIDEEEKKYTRRFSLYALLLSLAPRSE